MRLPDIVVHEHRRKLVTVIHERVVYPIRDEPPVKRRGAILSKASAKAETDTALLAAQKAARDARYAARKARK